MSACEAILRAAVAPVHGPRATMELQILEEDRVTLATSTTLSENALRVLEARYLARGPDGRPIETPDQLFDRVAWAVSRAEELLGTPAQALEWAEEFRGLLGSLDFLPNSPALMNAGTAVGQLSACFVLPVPDSLEGIFEAVKDMALIQRSGGGTGFSFSQLRPKGEVLASTGGEASGPVSFMKVFDTATEQVKLGGRRRGANLATLRVDHPDILDFVRAKLQEDALRNFNTSVWMTDAFMEAYRRGDRYDLIHPVRRTVVGRVRATEVFGTIVEAAWRNGEPGLLFGDAINRANPTPQLGAIEAANPCGEVPLLPYESCNLGSLNLAHLALGERGEAVVDWERLRGLTRTATRFLDDMIEVNRLPLASCDEATRRTRKLGLGVMGFAELLLRVGIPYGSRRSVRLADRLMRTISETAAETSHALAAERGVFPAWRGSVYEPEGRCRRNAACTAIAPTGTISLIAGTTAGIEPLFALAYRRRHTLRGNPMTEVAPLLYECLQRHVADPEAAVSEVVEKGRLGEAEGIPRSFRRLFVTALELSVDDHLAIQAAFQRHVDSSVSKTINLPGDATQHEVAYAYRRAWELGLKGVTVYRYGSRASQVIELGANEEPHHYDQAAPCDPGECRV